MAEFTYPVIVKPMQGNGGVLGIEYWFPDFEECEHIFYPEIDETGLLISIKDYLFMLLIDRQNACDRRPTPKWYGADDYPPNAQLRFITIDTNARSGYFAEKGEENMRHGLFDEISTGTPTLENKSYDDSSNYDAVNHPQHYMQSKIPCIDAIDSVTSGYSRPGHGYYAGTVLKYLWRAPFKGHYLQDLEKAQWYLNRLVKKVQDEADHGN